MDRPATIFMQLRLAEALVDWEDLFEWKQSVSEQVINETKETSLILDNRQAMANVSGIYLAELML